MKLKLILLIVLISSTAVFMKQIEDEIKKRSERLLKGTEFSKEKS